MPVYEFLCKHCKYVFDSFEKIRASSVKVCPRCGQTSAERLISGRIGLIFKGSGFYTTDYKRKNETDKHTSDTSGSHNKNRHLPADNNAKIEDKK